MAEISAALVKDLREKTGAGMMDCKRALTEAGGDFEKAKDWLRQKGLAAAAKKSARAATEGAVGSYIHMGGKIGVLVEVNCETDFVARNEVFQTFVRDVAMQIAAANPLWVRREEISGEVIEREKDIFKAQLKDSGKPEKVWDKILEGKLEKFFSETCLVDQPWIREPAKSITALTSETVAKLGENVVIRRFSRYVLGEGLAKKAD